MSIKNKAYIVGIYEHPTRKAEDKSLAQLHAESAKGALEDAGLSKSDIDGYFCAGAVALASMAATNSATARRMAISGGCNSIAANP